MVLSKSLEEPEGVWEIYRDLWKTSVIARNRRAEVEREIKDLKSDAELLHYVELLLDESGLRERLPLQKDSKSNDASEAIRRKGNELFHPKKKRYIDAVVQYNTSIALSESGSAARAIGYSNRSAVCFELQEYEDCIRNIELAREADCPENLIDKLKTREIQSLEAIKKRQKTYSQDIDSETLKLSYPPHPTIPQVANCLELIESDVYGRHVVTNRELNPGDVVIIEKPWSKILIDKLRYVRCNACYKESIFTLIPCEGCTVAMYCSPTCAKNAYDSYHRYECPIIRDICRFYTKVIAKGLRTVTTAVTAYGNDLDELKLAVDEIDVQQAHPFDLDWTKMSHRDAYAAVHSLETHQSRRDPSDLIQRSIFAIIMSDMLFNRTEMGVLCGDSHSKRQLIRSLLLRHSQTVPVNMHTSFYLEYYPICEPSYDEEQSAQICCPILSMINHSCAPNMVRLTLKSGHVAAIINRKVNKGGQLFDNYGFHHCLNPRAERQVCLAEQYMFECFCEACKLDYPMFFRLPSYTKVSINLSNINQVLQKNQVLSAKKVLPTIVKYLKATSGDFYPTSEVCSAQECLLRSFEIVYGEMSRFEKYRTLCNM